MTFGFSGARVPAKTFEVFKTSKVWESLISCLQAASAFSRAIYRPAAFSRAPDD
jgi:hypothetical protein